MAQEKKGPFQLDGTITGKNSGFVHLRYGNGFYMEDSCAIKNGSFSFKGMLSEPVMATISGDGEDGYDFYLDPGQMTINVKSPSFEDAAVTGSASQTEYQELLTARADVQREIAPLAKSLEDANKQYLSAIQSRKSDAELTALKSKADVAKGSLAPLEERAREVSYDFFRSHPDSYVTAAELRYFATYMKPGDLKSHIGKLAPFLQTSIYGQELSDILNKLQNGAPGSQAQLFSQRDATGKAVTPLDFKGKYLLLDFWGSWCLPCRKNNVHLKELYARYKDKGFAIIGIADNDSKPEDWKKAIDKDGIGIWTNILRGLDANKFKEDGKPQPGDIYNMYGVHAVPTQILINPEGMIIARFGSGGENYELLDTKLAEIL
ncbi:alkyl hydroperoxide reductase/ Thiol specific antioxidant/ Mal allergen [Chitinophaga pinensis DSM 2588]|uniref:Alkyl hydroperoxide reductase/ Thiol specific antioxidant/ Mal allergen n=2 Tax=Chitinophaga pinensis TaxID=79329 RepID=A0A979G655_CHIPD|nr:alkyl hydroperoxide reductase/ Thiol specific antioxidant/ Mal allergen [Chitinophaga pinensis DSM 2588]